MQQKNLIIAFGGNSPEHEVSVLTAIQAASALEENNWNLVPLYISKSGQWLTGEHLLDLESYKEIQKAETSSVSCHFETGHNDAAELVTRPAGWLSRPERTRIDALLCAFHGAEGENGAFQGLCETFNIPYSGSDVSSSALGMDKRLAKILCRQEGIPVVDDVWIREQEWIEHSEELISECKKIGFPLFVKPVTLGSSIGVQKVTDRQTLVDAVEESFRYDSGLLVEKAVQPLTEINCSVLGDRDSIKVSVCEQPLGKEALLSFEDKYMQGDGGGKGMASASREIPAPIPEEQTKQIQEYARRIFYQLGCSGVSRLDFLRNSESGEIFFNEINTIPGSFSYYLWEATELRFDQLLEELIAISMKRHQTKNSRVRSHEVNLLSQKAVKGLKGLKGGK